MMSVAWRIVRQERAADAFSGEGARLYGGRWNSTGTRVVYVSDSLALAALETLVHLNPHIPMTFVAFRLEWPSALAREPRTIPATWNVSPAGPPSQRVGDEWARNLASAVLAVPTALVPEHRNYLLNPAHPDFPKITIHPPQPFAFDTRLLPH